MRDAWNQRKKINQCKNYELCASPIASFHSNSPREGLWTPQREKWLVQSPKKSPRPDMWTLTWHLMKHGGTHLRLHTFTCFKPLPINEISNLLQYQKEGHPSLVVFPQPLLAAKSLLCWRIICRCLFLCGLQAWTCSSTLKAWHDYSDQSVFCMRCWKVLWNRCSKLKKMCKTAREHHDCKECMRKQTIHYFRAFKREHINSTIDVPIPLSPSPSAGLDPNNTGDTWRHMEIHQKSSEYYPVAT